MATDTQPEESRDGAQALNETPEPASDEQGTQEYFEQLAAVKDSILEGVITPW